MGRYCFIVDLATMSNSHVYVTCVNIVHVCAITCMYVYVCIYMYGMYVSMYMYIPDYIHVHVQSSDSHHFLIS